METRQHQEDKPHQRKKGLQDNQLEQKHLIQGEPRDHQEAEKIQSEDYEDFLKMRNKMNNPPFKRESSKSMDTFKRNKLRDFQNSIPDLKLIERDGNMQEVYLEDELRQAQDDLNHEKILQVRDSPDCSPTPNIQGQGKTNLQIISPMLQSRSSADKMAQDDSQNPFGTNSDYVIDRESMKSLSQRSGQAQDEVKPQTSQNANSHPDDYQGFLPKRDTNQEEDFHIAVKEPQPSKNRVSSSKINLLQDQRRVQRQEDSEVKSATLRPSQGLSKDNDQVEAAEKQKIREALYPPPEDIYRPVRVKHESVNFGLNMYFKKAHDFSDDPDQAGGDLAPNQTFSSMPWGVMGCPATKQENITDYVRRNIQDVVFSRYGMEYLRSFPRCDDLAIGSYRINLDYLIFQKQRHLDTDNNASLVGMSFLKTKGQVEMNRQFQQTQNASPDRRGASMAMGASMIIPFYKNLDPGDRQTLIFDSIFESGNLAVALKVSDTEYNCLLQNDINTNGHTQWFYFKVKSNFPKKTTVKINLINLYKPKSLYQYGMRVLSLDASKKDPAPGEDSSSQPLPKWQRSGSEVSYIQNRFTNEQSPNGLFQVQFSFEFEAGPKEIYFAHSMPYTYSMLNEYLNKKAVKGKAKRVVLCHSLAGNKVEYLYITNKTKKPEAHVEPEGNLTARKAEKEPVITPAGKDPGFKRQKSLTKKSKVKPIEVKPIQKQVLFITSRVHPGETNASWMMQGLLNTILTPKNEEEEELVNNLKDHFEFYIIPMLNVDGVINGNYRCSLASCDLNRKYSKPSKALHPPIYYTKKLCQQLIETEKKQFFLYLDLHGHSAKKNIFQYGNRTDMWGPSRQRSHCTHAPSVFPLMVSKQFDYFNFQDCTYAMPKNKESTARITMFHKLRIPFVFTLEASFAGASRGHLAGKHFSQGDFENVGLYVLKAVWELKKLELNKNLLKQITEEATKNARSSADDGGDSDDSSSEEEHEIQTKSKKVIEVIQDQEGTQGSPSPRRQGEASNQGAKDLLNQAVNPQGNAQKNKQAQNAPQPNMKGSKQGQNRSIISLKTITQGADVVSAHNNNSPRKQAQAERLHRESLGSSPVRRSIIKPSNQQFQHLDSSGGGGMAWIGDGLSDTNYNHNQQSPNANRESIHPQSEGHRPSSKQKDGDLIFDLTKNLIRTENPDTITGERSGLSSVESNSQQQELFEQFNAQIEQSFTEQQNHLDEIFRQTAKQFLEQRGQPGVGTNLPQGANQNQQNMSRTGYGNSRSQNTQSRFSNNDQLGNSPNKSGKQNWFLEQFLQQQKQNYQRDRGTNSINPRQQGYFTNDQHSQPYHQYTANSVQQQQQQSHAQIQTFLQLQKLHQMQKLNQMAQMQFFRQQAELLLSQNLTQQQQWEVFQQFSYYQAQIQMQNQQYQMMLSQSLHGNNMQVLKAQYATSAAQSMQNQTNQGFQGANFNLVATNSQVDDSQSNQSQKFMQHHQFNRQRIFANTQGGSMFKASQVNKSSKASEYIQKQADTHSQQTNPIDSNFNDSRTQSPLKQQENFRLNEQEQIKFHQDFQDRQVYMSQDQQPQTENSPHHQYEEQLDNYSSVSSVKKKRQVPQYARNSATALNSKNTQVSSKPINGAKPFSEDLIPAETHAKLENNEKGYNSRQTTNRNSTSNQSQQSVIKLKKGLVELKPSPGHQQALNFHANYKYPPEINAAPQFEPQNFSQLLNQHLVDQQYQHLPSQSSSQNASSNQINKKFFTTRGKFPKPPMQQKPPEPQDNESYEVHRNQNYGSRNIYANNMVGEQIKPNSQNFSRSQHNRQQHFSAHFDQENSSSTNYQNNMRQNLKSLHGHGMEKHQQRFFSDMKNEIGSPEMNIGKDYLQTSNTKSNYSMKKQQQFISTDANFSNKKARGHERNLTDAMQIVNSPPVRREHNQYFGGNVNPPSGVGSDLYNKYDGTQFQVTIGKSKLIPVLHPQRQAYVTSNESMLSSHQQPSRVAPGTAGGSKSGTNSGLAQNYGIKSDNLALNKSQDENIMKKHYGLGSGSNLQTPQQLQKYNNISSACRQQPDQFQDGDINHPKNSRHLQPVDFGSYSAPISQNTRKTPSQLKHYPPDSNQRQTIPNQISNQIPNDSQLPYKVESPQKAITGQNKKKSHQIRTIEKYDMPEQAMNFTQSNDRVNVNTSQAKFSDYDSQVNPKQPAQNSKQSHEREYQEHLNYQQFVGSQQQQKHQEIQSQFKSREQAADSKSFPIIQSQNQKSDKEKNNSGIGQNKQNR